MIAITDKGKAKVASVGTHGPGAKVLRYLASNGPSSLDEMQRALGPGVKKVTAALYRQGYIARE